MNGRCKGAVHRRGASRGPLGTSPLPHHPIPSLRDIRPRRSRSRSRGAAQFLDVRCMRDVATRAAELDRAPAAAWRPVLSPSLTVSGTLAAGAAGGARRYGGVAGTRCMAQEECVASHGPWPSTRVSNRGGRPPGGRLVLRNGRKEGVTRASLGHTHTYAVRAVRALCPYHPSHSAALWSVTYPKAACLRLAW